MFWYFCFLGPLGVLIEPLMGSFLYCGGGRGFLSLLPPTCVCVCVCVGLFSGFYVLAFLLQWHFQFINQTKKEKKRVNLFMSLIQQRKRCKSILKPDVQCFRWHWRWWTKLDFSFSIKKSFTSDRIIKNSKVIHGKQSFPEQSIFKLMAILLHKVIKNTKVLTW